MSPLNGRSPDVEVKPGASRRRFSAEYKRRIVAEADRCGYGEVGCMLRREGLYHSNLAKWRAEQQAGRLNDKARGPKANPDRAEVVRLQRENVALQRKLAQAEAIIEAQKKLARLLEGQQEDPS